MNYIRRLLRQRLNRLVFAALVSALLLTAFLTGHRWQQSPAPSTESPSNCTGYFELRGVNFLQDEMRSGLCENLTAFSIVGGRFPLCQLADPLPNEIEQEVKRKAMRNFIVSPATGRNVTVFGYQIADYISHEISRSHSWEPLLVSRLIKIMKALPTSEVTFLDVGSNIGVYSLQAVDAGFPTIAIDANIRNLVRMRLSARHLQVGPKQLRMLWAFFHSKVSIKYLEFNVDFCNVGGASGFHNQQSVVVDTVPVATGIGDDLLPHVKTRIIVMKIDIETSERVFFETSGKLIDKRQIAVVQMEWWRPEGIPNSSATPNYRFLVDFFLNRNYVLMSPVTLERLDPETFTEVDTIWVRQDFLSTVENTQ